MYGAPVMEIKAWSLAGYQIRIIGLIPIVSTSLNFGHKKIIHKLKISIIILSLLYSRACAREFGLVYYIILTSTFAF